MKKLVLKHPNHETDLQVFVGEVEGEERLIISIPDESYSVEMISGKIDWGYSNLFGHEDFRKDFEEQLKNQL